MQFDVYVPKSGAAEGEFDTLKVEAEDWTHALKTALAQSGGSSQGGVDGAICTVRDDGWLQVNEASGSRIFFVREIHDAAPTPAAAASGGDEGSREGAMAADPAHADAGTHVAVHSSISGLAAVGEVVAHDEEFDPAPEAVVDSGPSGETDKGTITQIDEAVSGLSRIAGNDTKTIAEQVLDVALRNIPCEAGSVFYSHLNGQDLYFAAARGPNSEKLIDVRIPMGRGIVGFATMEGACVGVSDVGKDARFSARVSQSIGFDTHNILCAPIMTDGNVFGAIELINKKAGAFNRYDLGVLSFVGYRLAEHLKSIFH